MLKFKVTYKMNEISQDKIKDYVWYYAFLPLKSEVDKEL